jgi:hypothetical protein
MPSGQDDALQPAALPAHVAAGGGSTSSTSSISERLHVLFAAALLLLNFPLLALWDHAVLVFGLPLFPLALFTIWAALIVVLAWWMERLPD